MKKYLIKIFKLTKMSVIIVLKYFIKGDVLWVWE